MLDVNELAQGLDVVAQVHKLVELLPVCMCKCVYVWVWVHALHLAMMFCFWGTGLGPLFFPAVVGYKIFETDRCSSFFKMQQLSTFFATS